MELRHLRYFVAVAEEMSFTRAAERLHIAQPPLSQQIQSLEAELGITLFNRTTRKISLTQVGKEFLPEARAILDHVSQLEQRTLQRGRGELGEITIAMVSALATPFFAGILRAFQKAHPGIKISLLVYPSMWQLEAFAQDKIDVGFLILQNVSLQEDLESFRVQKGSMKLAVPLTHPLAKKTQIEWKDLAKEDIILVERDIIVPDYYSEFRKQCQAAGFDPSVSQYTSNLATQIWLVSAGLGVAPVHIVLEKESWAAVKFVSLPKNAPTFEAFMTWKKTDPSPALKKFISFVKQQIMTEAKRNA